MLHDIATHRTVAIQRWLQSNPCSPPHFTSTYSTWMNPVERWFAELTTKWLRCGAHRSADGLTAAVERWVADWNHNPRAPCLAQDRGPVLRQPRQISQPQF